MPAYRTRDVQPRPLELDADALAPPAVAIIAPTPRAFTFPINTGPFSQPQLSPFSSPCVSPDLRCSSPITPVSTPPLIRAFSPDSVLSSPISDTLSPSRAKSPSSRRRKSSGAVLGGEPEQRRPKKGDEDYIKRPENAFILFRRKCVEDRLQAQQDAAVASAAESASDAAPPKAKKQRQADLSKMISQQWKALPAEEKVYWEALAKEKKKEHEAMYPNYVYRPQRVKKADKPKSSKKGKGVASLDASETDGDANTVQFVMPVHPQPSSSRHGRSLSAPTPPTAFQTIRLPDVPIPSCPGSPALLPSAPISRRLSTDRTPRPQMRAYEHVVPPPMLEQPLGPPFVHPFDLENGYMSQHESGSLHPGMYEIRQPTFHQSQLHSQLMLAPLSMIAMAPSFTLMSPADSIASSGPPSPAPGPFTPTALGDGTFIPCADLNAVSCDPNAMPDFSVFGSMPDLVYPAWSWEGASLWPSTSELLVNEDFDLGAIPPVELGLPKCAPPPAPTAEQLQDELSLPGPSSSSDRGPSTAAHQPWLLAPDMDTARSDGGHDPFAGISFDDMMISDRL